MGNAESRTFITPTAHGEVSIIVDENNNSFGEENVINIEDTKIQIEPTIPMYFRKKTGFLMKKGMGYLYRPWAKRYFVLDLDHSLTYYDGESVRGVLKLLGAAVRKVGESSRVEGCRSNASHVFEVYNLCVTNSSSLFNKQNLLRLRASSEKEMNEWIEALNLCFVSAERSQNIKAGVNSGSDGYASLSQLKVAYGENMDKHKQRGSD